MILERFGARVIGWAFFGLLILALIVFGVTQCQQRRSAGAQNRVNEGQTGALANNASDAIGTTQGVGSNAVASEDLTRTNEKEIRDAEGANDAVNPAARDAGLRSLCRRPAYRDSERCKLLQPPAR